MPLTTMNAMGTRAGAIPKSFLKSVVLEMDVATDRLIKLEKTMISQGKLPQAAPPAAAGGGGTVSGPRRTLNGEFGNGTGEGQGRGPIPGPARLPAPAITPLALPRSPRSRLTPAGRSRSGSRTPRFRWPWTRRRSSPPDHRAA